MKKRIITLCLLLALLLALFGPGTTATAAYEDVYLLGVNDTVMLGFINAQSMPVRRDGSIYAPCTLLENPDLELSYAINRTGGTFTVFNRQKTLVFQLNRAGATDREGNSYNARVISRDGVVFFPLRFVAEYFGLTYSFYNLVLPDGNVPIARVRTPQASLSDTQFGASAATMVAVPLRQYMDSQTVTPPAVNPPSPDLPPSPSDGNQTAPVDISFAVACTDGAGFQILLSAFASARYSALFLFSPDDLLTRDGDVRAAAAAGHQIGLLLGADDPEEDFRVGNERLGHILRSETAQVAFLSGGARAGNWKVWTGNIAPRGSGVTTQANNLESDISAAQSVARVTLNDSRTTAQAVQRNIRTWSQSPYTLVTATEVG